MIFNLIIGILAGVGARYAKEHIAGAIAPVLSIEDKDHDVLSLLVLLLAGGIVIGLSGANSMILPTVIGAGLGYFGTQVLEFGKAQRASMEEKMKQRNAASEADVADAEIVDEPVEAPEPKKPAAKRKPAAKKSTAK